jgi:hypothetical protein
MSTLDLILNLINLCFAWLKLYLGIKETKIDSREIIDLLRNSIGIEATNIETSDRIYYTTDIETWKKIFDIEWIKKRVWTERFDCDKFSRIEVGHILEAYDLNSIGEARGMAYNAETLEAIEEHSFNIFWDNVKNVYIQEPQTGKLVLFEKGKPLRIDNILYGIRKINI